MSASPSTKATYSVSQDGHGTISYDGHEITRIISNVDDVTVMIKSSRIATVDAIADFINAVGLAQLDMDVRPGQKPVKINLDENCKVVELVQEIDPEQPILLTLAKNKFAHRFLIATNALGMEHVVGAGFIVKGGRYEASDYDARAVDTFFARLDYDRS